MLISLKEKYERKKLAVDCETLLREVMANIDLINKIMNTNLLASDVMSHLRDEDIEPEAELDVAVVSDFSTGKLDLSQISEEIPTDSSPNVPFDVKEFSSKLGRSGVLKVAQKVEGGEHTAGGEE